MDVSFLQKNYFVVVLAVLFSIFYSFVTNMLQQKKDDNVYIKNVILSALISGAIVYIHTLDIPLEDISVGPAPF
jgi:O-antigen/teichoic acid export membrane protein